MNSTQRVSAALTGGPFDRRPFTVVLSLYGARLTGKPLIDHYRDPKTYVDGQMAVLETFHPDVLLTPFALPLFGEAFGGKVKFFSNQPPSLKEPGMSQIRELDALKMPDPESHPTLLYLRESLRRLVKRLRGEVPVAAFAVSPVDLPPLLFGLERWLNIFLTDPQGTRRVLEMTTDFFHAWVKACIADGASYVILPGVFGSPSIVTREIAEERVLPIYQESFATAGAPLILHHAGGPLLPFLEMFRGLPPNVVAIALDARDDFATARTRTGPKRCLLKGPDGPTLRNRKPEDIESACRTLLQDFHDDPACILSTSGADVPLDTDPENIHAIRRAVESEGDTVKPS